MDGECRECKHAQVGAWDKDWRTKAWYCKKFKEIIPEYVVIVNCPGYEHYESNLHDNNAARPSPQTRDNGIYQEE